jgi:hypothetical protein
MPSIAQDTFHPQREEEPLSSATDGILADDHLFPRRQKNGEFSVSYGDLTMISPWLPCMKSGDLRWNLIGCR